jgi:predicted O-methyltransferase YrrM
MSSGRLRQLLTLAVVGLLVGVTIVVLGLAEAHPLIQTAGWLILVGVLAFLLALVIVLLRRALAHLEALNGSHGPVRKDLARVRTLLGSAPGSLQARLRHDVLRDAQALRVLHDALPSTGEHVPLTSYSALPATALMLTEYVRELPPGSTIVELGSGATTLWLALAVRRRGDDVRIVSLDTSAEWAAVTRRALERNGVDALVDLRVADLVPVSTIEGEQPWYAPSGWSDLHDIDLLFVDGPPGATAPLARFPAVELIGPRLAAGAIVVLDDTDRADEQEIVQRWLNADLTAGRPQPLEQRERTVSLRLG